MPNKQLFPRRERPEKKQKQTPAKSVFTFYSAKVVSPDDLYRCMLPISGVVGSLQLFITELSEKRALLRVETETGPGKAEYKLSVKKGLNALEETFDLSESTRFRLTLLPVEEGKVVEAKEVYIAFTFSAGESPAPKNIPVEEVNKIEVVE